MICTNQECQTTAGCKCRKTVELNMVSPWPQRRLRSAQEGPCDQCAEFQDLQRIHESRELELLRKLEAVVMEREKAIGMTMRQSIAIGRLCSSLRTIETMPQPSGADMIPTGWQRAYFEMTGEARAAINALSAECAVTPDPASRPGSDGSRSIRLGATEIADNLVDAWHRDFFVHGNLPGGPDELSDVALGELTRRVAAALAGEPS